ncbi:MAG: hypothetical protein IT452_11010 [Planctomycetia bacterium]|nr:hypothetical protein [Planctomycetia bacterium]
MDYLRSLGYLAEARDWAMGETVQVYWGEKLLGSGPSAMRCFASSLCIFPADGGWRLVEFSSNCESPEAFPSLGSAVRATLEVIAGSRELRPVPLQVDVRPIPPALPPGAELLYLRDDSPECRTDALLNALRMTRFRWDPPATLAGMHLIRDSRELEELWASHGGTVGSCPAVDFPETMLVAIFGGPGERSSIPSILRVSRVGVEIRIEYEMRTLGWRVFSPVSIVAIARVTGTPVFALLSGPETSPEQPEA